MELKNILLGVIGAIVLVALLFGGWFLSTYNGLVTAQEGVDAGWAQVESQYQRRADLIPNLVETVKGFAAQEEKIFLEVTKYRSQWGAAKTQDEKIAAANGMDSAISRLLMVSENYPLLRSNENFLALQSQLEGTENRIAVERMRYNDNVRDYNTRLKKMPGSIIAGMYGFTPKLYFEAEKGAEVAPKVNFTK
jgi:LemA protein